MELVLFKTFKFSVAKVTLELQMSVHLSVCLSVHHKNTLSHHTSQPPSPSQNHNYWPSCLSAIMIINH